MAYQSKRNMTYFQFTKTPDYLNFRIPEYQIIRISVFLIIYWIIADYSVISGCFQPFQPIFDAKFPRKIASLLKNANIY